MSDNKDRDERIAMIFVGIFGLAMLYGAFWLATGGWR